MYMIYIRYMHRKIHSWVLDCKINALIDHTITGIITVYIRLYIFLKNDFKKQEMKKKNKSNTEYYVTVL